MWYRKPPHRTQSIALSRPIIKEFTAQQTATARRALPNCPCACAYALVAICPVWIHPAAAAPPQCPCLALCPARPEQPSGASPAAADRKNGRCRLRQPLAAPAGPLGRLAAARCLPRPQAVRSTCDRNHHPHHTPGRASAPPKHTRRQNLGQTGRCRAAEGRRKRGGKVGKKTQTGSPGRPRHAPHRLGASAGPPGHRTKPPAASQLSVSASARPSLPTSQPSHPPPMPA